MAEFQELKITAAFSNEMLEQIRAVVREELQAMSLQQWKPAIQSVNTSTVVVSSVTEKVSDPEIEGYPSLETEGVHDGKLYKGTLYYVKDVE